MFFRLASFVRLPAITLSSPQKRLITTRIRRCTSYIGLVLQPRVTNTSYPGKYNKLINKSKIAAYKVIINILRLWDFIALKTRIMSKCVNAEIIKHI